MVSRNMFIIGAVCIFTYGSLIPFFCCSKIVEKDSTVRTSNKIFSSTFEYIEKQQAQKQFETTIQELCKTESPYLKNKQKTYNFLDILVAKGADVKTFVSHNTSILSNVVQYGQRDLVFYLVKNGAIIKDDEKNKVLPLRRAIEIDNLWAIELLAKLGANIGIGSTPEWPPNKHRYDEEYKRLNFLLYAYGVVGRAYLKKPQPTEDLSEAYERSMGQWQNFSGPDYLRPLQPVAVPLAPFPEEVQKQFDAKQVKRCKTVYDNLLLFVSVSSLVNIILEFCPLSWTEYVQENEQRAVERYTKFKAGTITVEDIFKEE